jgi:hypothetical protein
MVYPRTFLLHRLPWKCGNLCRSRWNECGRAHLNLGMRQSLGITTTASQMTWSFARDRGVISLDSSARLMPELRCPSLWLEQLLSSRRSSTLDLMLFNDAISLTITGFYGSYLLPCSLLLYHRVKGNIDPLTVRMERAQRRMQRRRTTLHRLLAE